MVSTLVNALEKLHTEEPNEDLKFRPSAKWPINTDKVRQALKNAGFTGKVVARCDVPNEYSAAIYRWAENLQGLPALVVYPETEEQISVTVNFAVENKFTLSIRCGGHNGAPMASETILVDMRHFNAVKVDKETRQLTFGGGCNWGEVYEVANPAGLEAVGGGYWGVGVGGWHTGGGYSWLSGKYGMGCDNVLAVRMCLADGSIVTASEAENPDLFWSIRGGHGQLGVITEFTSQAYLNGGQALVGMLGYRPDQLNQVLDMLHDRFFPVRTAQESLVMGFVRPPPHYQPVVAIMPWIQGDDAYIAKIKSIFTDTVKPMVDRTYIAYDQVQVAHGADGMFAVPGAKRKVDGLTTVGDLWPEMALEAWQKWEEYTSNVPDCRGSVVLFECHSRDKMASKPSDATAWGARDPRYYAVCTGTSMTTATDRYAEAFALETAELIGAHHLAKTGKPARQWGLGRMNPDTQEFTYLYATNRDRLKQLKEEYDPFGVFQSPLGQQTHSALMAKSGERD